MAIGALKGAFLAQIVVALFMAIMLVFAWNAEVQTGLGAPVRDTLALWLYVAVPALAAGLLVGTLAGRVERRRVGVLVSAAALSYVAAAIASVSWMTGSGPADDPGAALVLGAWAAVAYGIFVVPLWTGAVIVLERWTRARVAR